MKHDCAWCRFERWLFEDITHVLAMIALVLVGVFGLSALFIGLVVAISNAIN